jgi:hypothetical protein
MFIRRGLLFALMIPWIIKQWSSTTADHLDQKPSSRGVPFLIKLYGILLLHSIFITGPAKLNINIVRLFELQHGHLSRHRAGSANRIISFVNLSKD